jgi:hypothetical protein
MEVFISWSGERSRAVAEALKSWLSDIYFDVRSWMSSHDIAAGSRWATDLADQLSSSNFGVLCLTPENLNAPWVLFEAGSLAKALDVARVVPYRFGLTEIDLRYPLAQFQGVDADQSGTFKLLESINAVRDDPLNSDRLYRLFAKWWPDLQNKLAAIPPSVSRNLPTRSERELLEEVLQLVRSLHNTQETPDPPPSALVTDPITGKRIQDIDEVEIMAMSTEDLERYIVRAWKCWHLAPSTTEETFFEQRIRAAESEISRRGSNC